MYILFFSTAFVALL
jgi:hypothetical protein